MGVENNSIDTLVDGMLTEGVSMSAAQAAVMECVKSRMCDGYCKYPAEYKVKEDDGNYERMIDGVCASCPLNVL